MTAQEAAASSARRRVPHKSAWPELGARPPRWDVEIPPPGIDAQALQEEPLLSCTQSDLGIQMVSEELQLYDS